MLRRYGRSLIIISLFGFVVLIHFFHEPVLPDSEIELTTAREYVLTYALIYEALWMLIVMDAVSDKSHVMLPPLFPN